MAEPKIIFNKRWDCIVEDRKIRLATDATGDVDATLDSIPEYGADEPIQSIVFNNGTLSLTILGSDDYTALSLFTGQDPDDVATKKFSTKSICKVPVWFNLKDRDNSKYIAAVYFGDWLRSNFPFGGAAGDKPSRAWAGNCDKPVEFKGDGVYVMQRVVELTLGEGTFTPIPTIEVESGIYAFRLLVTDDEKSASLIVTSTNVTLAGNIVISDDDLAGTGLVLNNLTYALVTYVASGGGVAGKVLTATPDKRYPTIPAIFEEV